MLQKYWKRDINAGDSILYILLYRYFKLAEFLYVMYVPPSTSAAVIHKNGGNFDHSRSIDAACCFDFVFVAPTQEIKTFSTFGQKSDESGNA